jgi:hypothetical protein
LWRRFGLTSGGVSETLVDSTATPNGWILRVLATLDGTGDLAFGTYGGTDQVNPLSVNDYLYAPAAGSGRAGIRGPEISVDFDNLGRPPVGFYYAGYLVDTLGARTLVDTLRSGYSSVTSQSRVNLVDADVNDLLPGLSQEGIRSSQVRNCAASAGVPGCANALTLPPTAPFGAFGQVVLLLLPKAAAGGQGPGQVQVGVIPDIATAGGT